MLTAKIYLTIVRRENEGEIRDTYVVSHTGSERQRQGNMHRQTCRQILTDTWRPTKTDKHIDDRHIDGHTDTDRLREFAYV